jgi:excisionase family DNA binding protein
MSETLKSFTTGQIAEMMQVKEETVRDYIKKGKLGAYKVGSDYRITEVDLYNYVETNRKKVK